MNRQVTDADIGRAYRELRTAEKARDELEAKLQMFHEQIRSVSKSWSDLDVTADTGMLFDSSLVGTTEDALRPLPTSTEIAKTIRELHDCRGTIGNVKAKLDLL